MYASIRVFSLIIAFISLAITQSYAQTSIGTAVSVDDTVTGKNSRQITTASNIFANERIRANSTGIGHFKFTDGTKLVVGPGTSLVLNELVYNPDGSSFNKFVF